MSARTGDALREWAAERGYRIAWFDGEVVRRAFDRVRRLRANGALDAGFSAKFLSWTSDAELIARSETKTFILLAVPRPALVIAFDDRGRRRDLALPPTYYRYEALFGEVLADAEASTGGALKLRRVTAPLKTVAALAGFARYGKNNIAYVDGFGSCVQLMGFATELALPGQGLLPENAPLALEECRSCEACRRACPTGAIVGDRFLYHGERCLTGFSECEGDLPAEFARLRTPTLIGCLACQEVCPANRGRLRFERLPHVFSDQETAYLLGGRSDGPPTPELAEKVLSLGLSDITVGESGPGAIFRRNLSAVLRDTTET
jgi:epoxyqueuosine reductase